MIWLFITILSTVAWAKPNPRVVNSKDPIFLESLTAVRQVPIAESWLRIADLRYVLIEGDDPSEYKALFWSARKQTLLGFSVFKEQGYFAAVFDGDLYSDTTPNEHFIERQLFNVQDHGVSDFNSGVRRHIAESRQNRLTAIRKVHQYGQLVSQLLNDGRHFTCVGELLN